VSANTYRPGRDRIQAIRWLAFFSALAAAFGSVPAWEHLNLEVAPGWARVALLLAALQGFYIAWMLATPDWSSVWVVALVFALVAAIYGMATAVALAMPFERPLPLDMEALRHSAPRWCGSVLLVNALFAYLCGNSSVRWRRSYQRETGGRSRP